MLLDGWVPHIVPLLLDPLPSQRRLGSLVVLDVADGLQVLPRDAQGLVDDRLW